MTNIQAALGLAQLERLDEFVERKRIMGKKYTQGLRVLNEVQLPLEKTDYAENIYWVFGVVLDDSIGFDAEEAMKMLEEKGIGCPCPLSQMMMSLSCSLKSPIILNTDRLEPVTMLML